LWPNLGVAGPLDMRSPKVMTHMFVHRSHYTIFGSLYPKELSNTEHDEWISHVYGYKNTFLHTAVQARALNPNVDPDLSPNLGPCPAPFFHASSEAKPFCLASADHREFRAL